MVGQGMWLTQVEGDVRGFHCLHLDSLTRPNEENMQRALVVARRLFHDDVLVEQGSCSKQNNGYDCGLYALVFCPARNHSAATGG